jgi:hypothetical protein
LNSSRDPECSGSERGFGSLYAQHWKRKGSRKKRSDDAVLVNHPCMLINVCLLPEGKHIVY